MSSLFDNGGIIGVSKDLSDTNVYTQISYINVEFVGVTHNSTNSTTSNVRLDAPVGMLATDNVFIHVVYENSTTSRPAIPDFSIINSRNGTFGGSTSTEVLYYGNTSNSSVNVFVNATYGGVVASMIAFRNVGKLESNSFNAFASIANGIPYTRTLDTGNAFALFTGVDPSDGANITGWYGIDSNFDFSNTFTQYSGSVNKDRAAAVSIAIGPKSGTFYSGNTINTAGVSTDGHMVANVELSKIIQNTTLGQKRGGVWGLNSIYRYKLTRGSEFTVEYLVIAGGASGGGGIWAGGGGGAGGYIESTLTANLTASYNVTIGAGGSGSASTAGANGSNSTFASIIAIGGGGGSSEAAGEGARSGGSGGGGRLDNNETNVGQGVDGQGNDGGAGSGLPNNSGRGLGGGGGGAGAAGQASLASTYAGNGGIGITSTITGSSVTRAGGGGGGAQSTSDRLGLGGTGGGGNGSNTASAGTSGSTNTGGGGGGAGSGSSGSGGSGIIILKIPENYTANFTAGVAQTVSTITGYKIYTITAAGATDKVNFL